MQVFELSLLTGVLPKAKTWKNKRVGEGYILTFAGVFTLKRRERRAPKTLATRPHAGGYEIWVEGLDCIGWLTRTVKLLARTKFKGF